ncbi:hypothetical protein DFH09DRAFT_1274864 [Mycena vulgaris]|nr:hypothetical protein DFH09DRAFT_1274864 [Mycena vulgaris]
MLIIFRCALPPSWVLTEETSLPPFPQSIWSVDLRTKLAIVRVCKPWHRIGLELLYNTVTLRRISQITTFVSALEAHDGLGSLVRKLNISCFVPRGYSELHDHEIKTIFQLCPRLSHFGFKPPFFIPGPPKSPPAVGRNITSLEYNRTVEYSLVFPTLVQLCASLQSLALSLPTAYDASYPTLVFEQLRSLRVGFAVSETPPQPKWILPALRRLWLHGHRCGVSDAEAFLDLFGRTISFLWLYDFAVTPRSRTIQGLLDRCPALEHLTIPRLLYRAKPRLQHGLIHSLDIISLSGKKLPASFMGEFTVLRSFRILDPTLAFPWDVIPPGLPNVTKEGGIVDSLEASSTALDDEGNPPDAVWINAVLSTESFPNIDWGSNYDSDPQSGSEPDSDTETSDVGGDDSDREIGREEALAIFRGL